MLQIADLDLITIEIAHTASTWGMVGVIWFVQLIHYPLMSRVSKEAFPEFEKSLCFRTSFVVIPLMAVELLAALLLLQIHSPDDLYLVNFLLVAAIWLSTFFIQVPLHKKLLISFDAAAHSKLVTSNWIRTGLWTIRGVLALYLLLQSISPVVTAN